MRYDTRRYEEIRGDTRRYEEGCRRHSRLTTAARRLQDTIGFDTIGQDKIG